MADKVSAGDLRKLLKPSDIQLYRTVSKGEAPFGNSLKYIVACNAIRTCQALGDAWVPFSFDEYRTHSGRMYGRADKFILDQFVEKDLLELSRQGDEEKYVITHALLVKTV